MADDYVELDLSVPAVVDKYKAAKDVANNVMLQLLQFLQPGQNVVDICSHGDKLIEEGVANTSKKVKKENKGVAFPVCISVNNCVGHFSPLPEDAAVVLKEGDCVKIDLGIHIDGFISQCAHTTVLGQRPEAGPLKGKLADCICAVYFAAECAHKLLRPGRKNTEITNAIRKVADIFHVNPCEGVLSHQIKQNVIDGNRVVINKTDVDQTVEEFAFEVNEAYVIDIVMSTGDGKPKEMNSRTTVFKRAVDRTYNLKLQAARTVFSEIQQRFPTLAFTLRALDEKKRRLGITEIVKHDLLDNYPVLFEKEGEYVVQFKFTALLLPNSTERLNSFPLPHVTSDYSVDSVPEIKEILALSTKRKKKGKKKKKAAGGGGGGDGGAAPGAVADDGDDEE